MERSVDHGPLFVFDPGRPRFSSYNKPVLQLNAVVEPEVPLGSARERFLQAALEDRFPGLLPVRFVLIYCKKAVPRAEHTIPSAHNRLQGDYEQTEW